MEHCGYYAAPQALPFPGLGVGLRSHVAPQPHIRRLIALVVGVVAFLVLVLVVGLGAGVLRR
jgi:hypothetical protein